MTCPNWESPFVCNCPKVAIPFVLELVVCPKEASPVALAETTIACELAGAKEEEG